MVSEITIKFTMAKTPRVRAPIDPTRKIIRPDKLKENLCLYHSPLNALPPEKREAFAGSDPSLSGKGFKDFIRRDLQICKKAEFKKWMRIKQKEGYNATDMAKWLNYLKKNGFIKSYLWKECKWKDWYMERVFRARAQESYILFGYGLTGEERTRMTKKMTALENEKDENGKALAPEKIAANKYDQFFKSKSRSKYTHGVSVGVDRTDGGLKAYIYDNGLNVRHEYSVEKLAERITYPFHIRVFDIEV